MTQTTSGVPEGSVRITVADGIGTVEFAHPKGNSLPAKLLNELAAAITSVGADPAARVIVLRSAGESTFCAGASFDEFTALIDQIKTDGAGKPLCVGIESGGATGWPFTDWVEEMVLRQDGPDVYDQWVNHEIPFNDPQITEAMQTVVDLWSEDNVYASGGSIAATAFPGKSATAARC